MDRSCGELAGGGELVQRVCVVVLIRVFVFGIHRLIMVRKKESKKHHGVSRGDGRVGKDGGGGCGAVNNKASSAAGGKLTQRTHQMLTFLLPLRPSARRAAFHYRNQLQFGERQSQPKSARQHVMTTRYAKKFKVSLPLTCIARDLCLYEH